MKKILAFILTFTLAITFFTKTICFAEKNTVSNHTEQSYVNKILNSDAKQNVKKDYKSKLLGIFRKIKMGLYLASTAALAGGLYFFVNKISKNSGRVEDVSKVFSISGEITKNGNTPETTKQNTKPGSTIEYSGEDDNSNLNDKDNSNLLTVNDKESTDIKENNSSTVNETSSLTSVGVNPSPTISPTPTSTLIPITTPTTPPLLKSLKK